MHLFLATAGSSRGRRCLRLVWPKQQLTSGLLGIVVGRYVRILEVGLLLLLLAPFRRCSLGQCPRFVVRLALLFGGHRLLGNVLFRCRRRQYATYRTTSDKHQL